MSSGRRSNDSSSSSLSRRDSGSSLSSGTVTSPEDGKPVLREKNNGVRKFLHHRKECVKNYTSAESNLKRWCQSEKLELSNRALEIKQDLLPNIGRLLNAALSLFDDDHAYYLLKEIDARVWKYGIYRFITTLRSDDSSLPPESRDSVITIIEMGIDHFQELLKKVCDISLIDLRPVFARTELLRMSSSKEPSSFEDVIYRIFIYNGDLYRYRFQIDKDPHNIKMAKSMYIGARFCDSVKTRTYNQLGLVAKAQCDVMGIIYNFTRACHGNVPVDGAKQQLQMVYGDMSQWYNKCNRTFWYTRVKIADLIYVQERVKTDNIWVFDSHTNKSARKSKRVTLPERAVPSSRRDHLENLEEEEILVRFSGIYAHFLGMLYTNIGTEIAEHVTRDLLVYFEGLFLIKNHSKFNFLLEVLGMILFIIDYLLPPPPTVQNSPLVSQKSHLRNVAMNASIGMMMVLVRKIKLLMETYDWENPVLISCTAAVHVWCTWAARQQDLLTQLKKINDINLEKIDLDVLPDDDYFRAKFCRYWFVLIALIQEQVERNVLFPKLKHKPTANTEQLNMLPEKVVLDGFTEVLLSNDMNTSNYHFDQAFSQEVAQNAYRFTRILQFTSDLCGEEGMHSTPVFDSLDSLYIRKFRIIPIIHKIRKTIVADESRRLPDSNNARVIIRINRESIIQETEDSEEDESKAFVELPKLKLTGVSEIFTELQLIGVRTEMIIRPTRVVLDTNTLIGNLKWVHVLRQLVPYQLIIPTTVLLELRGLAKGAKSGESPRSSQKSLTLSEQRARMEDIIHLGEECLKALAYLHDFKRYFKLVRVDGTELVMHKYKTQKVFEPRLDTTVRNDEKILRTCQQLELHDANLRRCDSMVRIYRNTVLLTGDRSLRLRAYGQDIPASDIQSFTNWIQYLQQGDK